MSTSEPLNPVHGQILPGAPPLCRPVSGVIRATTTVKDITCDICKSWVKYYNPEQEVARTTSEHVHILTEHILGEQARLWSDLAEHLRRAANRVWSTGCDSAVYRLVLSMRLVGVIDMGKVQWPLIAGDVYQTICRTADIPFTDWSEEEWEGQEFRLMEYGGRKALQVKYAWTNAIIMAPCDGIKDANYELEHAHDGD